MESAKEQSKFAIDDKYKRHNEENENAKKINNEVWWIVLKFLGFYDFND